MSEKTPTEPAGRHNAPLAIAIIGGCTAGVVAILTVIPAWFEQSWMAVGMLLLAAGVSFGLLANALLRR